MTVATKPLTCVQQFVKLTLRVEASKEMKGNYSLELLVNRQWWEKFLGDREEGQHIPQFPSIDGRPKFISIDKNDLRCRFLPKEMSTLKLLGKDITIDQYADDLDILINATVELTKSYRLSTGDSGGFEATIKSGSIVIKNFHDTFKDIKQWNWLFHESLHEASKSAELLLGRSKIQLKLNDTIPGKTNKGQLYEFIGKEAKTGDAIWQMIPCPHEDLYSPLDLLADYEDLLAKRIQKAHQGKAIAIKKFPQPDTGVYRKQGFSETYLKPGLKVYIYQESGQQGIYGPPMIWVPQSLKVTKETNQTQKLTLLDVDQIDMLLQFGEIAIGDEFKTSIQWSIKDEKRSVDIQERMYLSHPSDPEVLHDQYLWQTAKLKDDNAAHTWVRHKLESFPNTSEIDEKSNILSNQSETLSGSVLKFYNFDLNTDSKSNSWMLLFNLMKHPEYKPSIHPQLQMEVSEEVVSLQLYQPNIIAQSPETVFFISKLKDSSSMPADKLFAQHATANGDVETKSKLKKASFVFRNHLDQSSESIAKLAVNFEVSKGKITYNSGQVKEKKETNIDPKRLKTSYFELLPIAVVDRISAGWSNLEAIEQNPDSPKSMGPSIQRDPSHGFLEVRLVDFIMDFQQAHTIIKPADGDAKISVKYATEALMPWVERLFSDMPDKKAFYHRNLIMEHGEFELAKAYQEEGSEQSTYNAQEAFVQATRDRYCLASDIDSADPKLTNWNPALKYKVEEQEVKPKIKYHKEGSNVGGKVKEFPEIELTWDGAGTELNQALSIDSSNKHWLDYWLKPEFSDQGVEFDVKKGDSARPAADYHSTRNSYTPLLHHEDQYYDNLGVIHAKKKLDIKKQVDGQEVSLDNWKIEALCYPKEEDSSAFKKCYSVSTTNMVLADDASLDGEYQNLTQVKFSCDGFKVDADGKVVSPGNDKQFHQSLMNLGVYGFYSDITAPQGSLLSAVNHWPRFHGVPFLVTAIEEFTFNEHAPSKMVFTAVVANPQLFNAATDKKAIPNFVLQSLKNNQVVHFTYDFDKGLLSILNDKQKPNQIDWQFNTPQASSVDQIDGTLTRLSGFVSEQGNKVIIQDFAEQSEVFTFGKVWKAQFQSMSIESDSMFIKKGRSIEQQTYEYRSRTEVFKGKGKRDGETKLRVEIPKKDLEFSTCLVGNQWISKKKTEVISERGKIFLLIDTGKDTDALDCSLYAYSLDVGTNRKEIGHGKGKTIHEGNALLFEVSEYNSNVEVHAFEGSFCKITKGGKSSLYLIKKAIKEDGKIRLIFDDSWKQFKGNLTAATFQIFEINYLSFSSTDEKAIRYHIPVVLSLSKDLPQSSENLEAIVTNDAVLLMYLRAKKRNRVVTPTLIQGDLFCFLVQANSEQYTTKGHKSLMLWLEAGRLMAMLVVNVMNTDPEASKYTYQLIDSNKKPKRLFEAGIDVQYLSSSDNWHHYTNLSLVLEYDHVILRFDDQDFSDLRNSKKAASIKTGYVQIQGQEGVDKDKLNFANQIQGPVRVHLEVNASKQVIITIKEGWFSLQKISFAAEKYTKPDIIESNAQAGNTNYVVKKVISVKNQADKSKAQNQYFVSLVHNKKGIHLTKIEQNQVPINFCLEPGSIGNTPKLQRTNPQSIHRQMFGNMLRIDLHKVYEREIDKKAQGEKINLSDWKDKWILSPLSMSQSDQLVMMSDNAFLEKFKFEKSENNESESVLIINRPISTNIETLPFMSLSNRTLQKKYALESETENIKAEQNRMATIQKRALEVGASGIIIRRVIDQNGKGLYQYIPSPFYGAQVGHTQALNKPAALEKGLIETSSIRTSSDYKELFDFRCLLPSLIMRIDEIDFEQSYQLLDSEKRVDKKPCVIHREVAFTFQGTMNHDYQSNQPSLYFYEHPAFQKMDPLWYLPTSKQTSSDLFMQSAADKKRAYFLPYNVNVKYGSDKPGSVMHHEMRNITQKGNQLEKTTNCNLGKNLDFALREEQQVKTEGCISAAIENVELDIEEKNPALSSGIALHSIKANWDDVFGRVRVDDLDNSFCTFDLRDEEKLAYQAQFQDEEEAFHYPFKLAVQHNFDVYELTDLEQAIPAYFVEKYNEQNDQIEKISWWANYFVIGKNKKLLPSNIPTKLQISDPDGDSGENPNGTQTLQFNFSPYLILAELEVDKGASTAASIALASQEDAEKLATLPKDIRVFIPGLMAEMNGQSEMPLEIKEIKNSKIEFKHSKVLHRKSIESKLFIVLPLHDVMKEGKGKGNYYLWSLKLEKYRILDKFTKFQIMWLSSCNKKAKVQQGSETVTKSVVQMANCSFYNVIKQVKLLMPGLTSPKVAGVLHGSTGKGDYKRTVFFGNGASIDKVQSALEIQHKGKDFVKLFAPDEEQVEVSYPKDIKLSKTFYVLKYMPRGQVVFDKIKK